MARKGYVTAAQRRGQALLAYGRTVAQEYIEAAKMKAIAKASLADDAQPACPVPSPKSADVDASVCGRVKVLGPEVVFTCGLEPDHEGPHKASVDQDAGQYEWL